MLKKVSRTNQPFLIILNYQFGVQVKLRLFWMCFWPSVRLIFSFAVIDNISLIKNLDKWILCITITRWTAGAAKERKRDKQKIINHIINLFEWYIDILTISCLLLKF